MGASTDTIEKSVWKFELAGGIDKIEMPRGAQILCVQAQRDSPQLWALVDPNAPKVTRVFRTYGTGWDFDATGLSYVGTFQLGGGSLVFHVFEQ